MINKINNVFIENEDNQIENMLKSKQLFLKDEFIKIISEQKEK